MKQYNPQRIEKKWQKIWEEIGIFKAKDFSKKPKFYCLDMFPYPSAEGLHVGHPRGYIASDIISHYLRRLGFNILHPMGWDAFGLPAENYAIRTGIHPAVSTRRNIKNIKRQIKSLGLSYDWSREINTTDPEYYKFSQWIFLLLYKQGLAYEAVLPINWCPSCKTGLANEEVIDGKCERCGAEVEEKHLRQWVLKITAFAERLLEDLEELDWPEKIKEMQRNWIGKSCGVEIKFPLATFTRNRRETKNAELRERFINVFTTRVDTLFGCTYLVLAPEHPFVASLLKIKNQKGPYGVSSGAVKIKNIKYVKKYVEESKKKTERERISEVKEKSGIEIKGIKAINPVNGREVPIWIADYVLIHYGTGAIMAVPAHDQRDFDFAKCYNLPIIDVINPPKPKIYQLKSNTQAYEGEGTLINSDRFTGMKSEIAKERIGEWLEKKDLAKRAVYYKLRDWIFSRQRYWGEPIPIVHCPKCGIVPLLKKDLPLKLPKVKKYQPSGTGESPLATIGKWLKTKCPECGSRAKRETNTMPQWAGSCWYYLAYIMLGNQKSKIPKGRSSASYGAGKNQKFEWNTRKINYWLPVDLYVGGAEHAVLHLLYARFWHKFLFDLGLVSTKEPFLKLRNQGLILAPDGQKMSKSRGNVISPDGIVKKYGADTLRLYEMFIGPFGQEVAWSLQGIKGCFRFLERVWKLKSKISPRRQKPKTQIKNQKLEQLIHKTVKKITDDIENFKFNTAVSALMILVNEMEKQKELPVSAFKILISLLAPFAPHLSEELWQQLNLKPYTLKVSIQSQPWPKYDKKLIKAEIITLVIQINGKVRDKIEVEADISEERAKEIVLAREKVKKWIGNKEIKKVVFVLNKLINIVIE